MRADDGYKYTFALLLHCIGGAMLLFTTAAAAAAAAGADRLSHSTRKKNVIQNVRDRPN